MQSGVNIQFDRRLKDTIKISYIYIDRFFLLLKNKKGKKKSEFGLKSSFCICWFFVAYNYRESLIFDEITFPEVYG